MSNPYSALPDEAFWRLAIAERHPSDIDRLWKPKFPLHRQEDRIATAGSCFAQHIGKALASNGFRWMDTEPAPSEFDASLGREYGYGIFTFRTGNIYTATALKQWLSWAFGISPVPDEYWEKDGRYYDPFRPNIEPGGFASLDEMLKSRQATLGAIRRAIKRATVFVFTLGLTEAWKNNRNGDVYPMCPGTVAGRFDREVHEFINFSFPEVYSDLKRCLDIMHSRNPALRFLLTVSPVPLTATASGDHVLVATTYSKSVLRAVAGEMAASRDDTDYFPSYEIITSAPFRGWFYQQNMRSVTPQGVSFVMESFFASHPSCGSSRDKSTASGRERKSVV